MAAEIEVLNSTVEELPNANNFTKRILDIKQNEWIKMEKKEVACNAEQSTTNASKKGSQNPSTVLQDQLRKEMQEAILNF